VANKAKKRVGGIGKVIFDLNSVPCHEDIQGSGSVTPPFLTSVLDGGEFSSSLHHFTPGKQPPGIHSTGGWMADTAGLDVTNRKISYSYRDSETSKLIKKQKTVTTFRIFIYV
jgi:hypothetical protein